MSVAFVFPGQGSQSVGMLAELAEQHTEVKDTFSQASEVLGYDLWELVQNGPEEELNQTARTQPAMLTAGIAVWRVWQKQMDFTPSYMAGHSLGEYSALVASGALQFDDAVRLVEQRGQLMQAAVPAGEGAMAAILGLSDSDVEAACQQAAKDGVVEAVNYNAPGQVVIAGHRQAVEKATELAQQAGAKRAMILPVSVPSHCELMQDAADKLAGLLKDTEIQMPTIPVVHNASVIVSESVDEIRQQLARQLHSPVRWVESIQWLQQQGVDTMVECGPGKVLAGLARRIDKTLGAQPLFDQKTLDKTREISGVQA